MDAVRFDRLSRALSTRPSRRRLLRSLASGTLAALGGRVAVEDAAAARNRCRGKPDVCKSMTPLQAICGQGGDCVCLTTVGGKKECVQLDDVRCPTRDQCDDSGDCRGKDNLCMVVRACCGGSPRNVCARRCGAGGATATAASSGELPLLGRP
jgi:hypothetical protein